MSPRRTINRIRQGYDRDYKIGEAQLEPLLVGDWTTRTGHACWKCQNGAKPCVQGRPGLCEYPRARND